MPLYDHSEDLSANQSLSPATYTASANGTGVSLGDYEAAMVVFDVGTITDGTHTPTVEKSVDNGSSWTALTDSDLVGSLSDLSSDTVQEVGFVGSATDLRAVTTVSGATSGGVYSATVVLGEKGSL